MAPAKETAEEQLLRMIEGPGGPAAKGAPRPSKRFPFDRLLEPFQRGGDFFRRWRGRSRPGKERSDTFLWQLQLAGRLFWMCLAGLAVYLVIDLWVVQPSTGVLTEPITQLAGPPSGGGVDRAVEDQLRASAAYRSTLAARNPFRLATGRAADALQAQTVRNRLTELTDILVVVGINRGRVPEALVEDTETSRTYFVKVGDEVNGLLISAIDDNGVTVSYEGEEAVLQ